MRGIHTNLNQDDFDAQIIAQPNGQPMPLFDPVDDSYEAPMDEDFFNDDNPACQEQIRRMKDVVIPTESLTRLMFFATAFCYSHQYNISNTLNNITTVGDELFVNGQFGREFITWTTQSPKSIEYQHYEEIWKAEEKQRETTWNDCSNPNNPILVTFKCPTDDIWDKDRVFYRTLVMNFLSESKYDFDMFDDDDLTNSITNYAEFYERFQAGNLTLTISSFADWLMLEVYNDDADVDEARSRIDWYVDIWRTSNKCHLQVTTGNHLPTTTIPKNFTDFITKGNSFFFFYIIFFLTG